VAIRPVRFTSTSVDVHHDEGDHSGSVPWADLRFAGGVRFIEIDCPGCDAVSVHPIGGGSAPAPVQRLFARLLIRRATALGIPEAERTWEGIKPRLRALVEAMDGPGRWRLQTAEDVDDLNAVRPRSR
jgi:hypothetical protein